MFLPIYSTMLLQGGVEEMLDKYEKARSLTAEERLHICDMGFYNDVIRGYLIRAMKEADFQEEEIERALSGLRWALDSMTAAEAEKFD